MRESWWMLAAVGAVFVKCFWRPVTVLDDGRADFTTPMMTSTEGREGSQSSGGVRARKECAQGPGAELEEVEGRSRVCCPAVSCSAHRMGGVYGRTD
ncbi:hypothetical protein BCV70DRAFT_120028 [Testicularia cyperi]|uniref:Secreted protein n=1 Tax=Testicularia cyperi TaxID=1882483 RepID=A0A317XNS7_9BASI|nr:hypothetical protein BCV70DRAFT_120028 [Testicularia cyperi]